MNSAPNTIPSAKPGRSGRTPGRATDRLGLILTLAFTFAAALNTSANTLFLRQITATNEAAAALPAEARIRVAKADADGSLLVAGDFTGTLRFDSAQVPPLDSTLNAPAWFLGRLDVSGRWQWARKIKQFAPNDPRLRGPAGVHETRSELSSMAISSNAIYLGGFQSWVPPILTITSNRIGFRWMFTTNVTAGDRSDAGLVIKVSKTDGTPEWEKPIESENRSRTFALAVDSRQNLYVGGSFQNTATLGSVTLYDIRTMKYSLPPGSPWISRKRGDSIDWDLFLFKIAPDGATDWGLQGGSYMDSSRDEIRGIAVDADDRVYVVGNWAGSSRQSLKPIDPFLLGLPHVHLSSPRSNTVGTFAENSIETGYISSGDHRYFLARLDWNDSPFNQDWGSIHNQNDLPQDFPSFGEVGVQATAGDMALWDGKLYLAGKYHNTAFTNSFIRRHEQIALKPDQAIAYFRSGEGQEVLRVAPSRGAVLATGRMGRDMSIWNQAGWGDASQKAATNITSSRPNMFLVSLDRDLKPSWIRSTTQPNDYVPPSLLSPEIVAFSEGADRIWWGGSFDDVNASPAPLILGDPPTVRRVLPATGSRQGPEGFLTALTRDGSFVEEVNFRIRSLYGPIRINGQTVGSDEPLSYFKGTVLTNEVPAAIFADPSGELTTLFRTTPEAEAAAQASAVSRHRCVGFHVTDSPVSGGVSSYVMNLTRDTDLIFGWATEHLLEVRRDITAATDLTSPAAGNPQPTVGKHWVAENELVTAMVDGVLMDPDPSRFGTRYISAGYAATGAAGTEAYAPFGTVRTRQQVPQFPMVGPASLTYTWTRQHRIQVSTSGEDSQLLPMIISKGSVASGSGEFWYDDGVQIHIGARATGNGKSLQGWRNADGEFPLFQGSLDTDFEGQRVLLFETMVLPDPAYPAAPTYSGHFRTVTRLSRPTRVMWDYADQIFYPPPVALGEAIRIGEIAAQIQSALPGVELRTSEKPTVATLVDSPPASTVGDMFVWDEVQRSLWPVRPGISVLQWPTSGQPVLVQVTAGFPGTPIPGAVPDRRFPDAPRYHHVASTPRVSLDPSPSDGAYFEALKYSTGDAAVSGDGFTAQLPGHSVLLFRQSTNSNLPATGNPAGETVKVRVVETRDWQAALEEPVTPLPFGLFGDSSDEQVSPEPTDGHSPTIADLDHDGLPDLLIGQSDGRHRLYLNRGRGRWTNPLIITPPDGSPEDSRGLAAGDVNGDHLVDLLDGHEGGSSLLYINNGTADPFSTPPRNVGLRVGDGHLIQMVDLDGDGRLDVVGATPDGQPLIVLLNQGGLDPLGGPSREVAHDRVPTCIRAGDINGDARPDLIITTSDGLTLSSLNPGNGDFNLLMPLGTPDPGQPAPGPTIVHLGATRVLALASGDLDGDSNLDLVQIAEDGVLTSHRGKGDGQFEPASVISTAVTDGHSIELADLDGDGDADLVVGRTGSRPLYWIHRDATALFQFADGVPFGESDDSAGLILGDLDQDGLADAFQLQRHLPGRLYWNRGTTERVAQGVIGTPLTSAFDTARLGTGYVFPLSKGNAPYNPQLHLADGISGPIIPVNRRLDTQAVDPLLVVWYQRVDGILWPYQPVRYDSFRWPETMAAGGMRSGSTSRIVIASRLGSEGLDVQGQAQLSFNPEFFDQVAVYQQSDPTRPGYNPNEEHAVIVPSFLHASDSAPPPTAYALRDDLNRSERLIQNAAARLTTNDYTSDPYVLVQYRDRRSDTFHMKVYSLQREDAHTVDVRLAAIPSAPKNQRYTFDYRTKAGEQVNAPYPLNLLLGLSPCVNTVPTPAEAIPNGTYFLDGDIQRTYWVDHKGGAWAVSGGGILEAYYYYRVPAEFWYPFDRDPRASGPGDCVPWLLRFASPSAAEGPFLGIFDDRDPVRTQPVRVRYQTQWPESLPILKAGETLTFSGGEHHADHPQAPGLPGVVGWKAGQVIFDSLNPGMVVSATAATNFTAWIIAPLEERVVPLPRSQLPPRFEPAQGNVSLAGTEYHFKELPPSLQRRIFYDPFRKLSSTDEGGVLGIRGYVNDRTLGAADLTAAPPPVYVLEPNILNPHERDQLLGTSRDAASGREDSPFRINEPSFGSEPLYTAWNTAVRSLFARSRNPSGLDLNADGEADTGYLAGLEAPRVVDAQGELTPDGDQRPRRNTNSAAPLRGLGAGLALIPSPRFLQAEALLPTGEPLPEVSYVTLAENNDPSLGAAPVTLHLIQVVRTNLYRGAIKTIASANVFDEKLTLRHTADFGGNADQVAFSWWYREDDGQWRSGDSLPGDPASSLWTPFAHTDGTPDLNQIDLQGANPLLLADQQFFVRYRHRQAPPANTESWSAWAGAANSTPTDIDGDGKPDFRPQLAPGWVKRVFNRLTPYEARFNDFQNNQSPATYSSLIRQAGPPSRGAVALNGDKDVVENLGLIEIYETVLERARKFTIEATQPTATPGIQAALMLGATRLTQLYRMLGDEAVADAYDPTIGFGTHTSETPELGRLAPTLFAFQNQVGSLLDEELALLRGLDEDRAWPIHNRLSWNFTRAEGEAAYANSYHITDLNQDGFINALDGQLSYPQGHGDAWGHYLSAIRAFYDLLRQPHFRWQTRAELFNQLDVVFPVDYLDERKFAEVAGARAAAGAEIVALTYRQQYTDHLLGQEGGYSDPDASRAWGVEDWARRAGTAAVLDWITANALLPAWDTNATHQGASGVERLDRSTVPEISRISANLGTIQMIVDSADGGQNPLGVDPRVVMFDIDPTFVDVGSTAQIGRPAVQGLTHFEQIYERAYAALNNATVAFNFATQRQNQLRVIANDTEEKRKQAIAQDIEFRNRLIEIFGTPYQGAIGSGRPYPSGYAGPDLNLWMYVDVRELSDETVPRPSVHYAGRLAAFTRDLEDVPSRFREVLETHFLNALPANLASWTNVVLDDSVLQLQLPMTARGYTFQAPVEWGQRVAPGRLQLLVSDMMQAEAEISITTGNYQTLVQDIEETARLILAKAITQDAVLGLREDRREQLQKLLVTAASLRGAARIANAAALWTDHTGDSVIYSLPVSAPIVGLAGSPGDVLGPARGAIKAAANGASQFFQTAAIALEESAEQVDIYKEWKDLTYDLELEAVTMPYELREMLKELDLLLINEGASRVAVSAAMERLRQKADEFRGSLQEGLRLMAERETANQQLAAATQQNRYQDYLFRNARHEALQKYRTAFDLAARYTYCAAKAFDFETNFRPDHRVSARPLLGPIVRERTLGQILEGQPQHKGGLAGLLASLYENFRVIEGQLGFNNLQLEYNEFSLRSERFGIEVIPDPADLDPATRQDTETEAAWKLRLAKAAGFPSYRQWTERFSSRNLLWRNTLKSYRRANLWEVPEFRRFCRPFAARGATPEPGLVIPLPTEVRAAKNLFGRPLSPGDSAYDPTAFATKIRSVQVRLKDYDTSLLAETPRVYLVPAGDDVMYVPDSPTLETQSWRVVDQRLPMPVATGEADLTRPDWIATLTGLGDVFGGTRRFSSFRAYHEESDEDHSLMRRDTRLVGRSVWNTQWLLIIPGQTLLSDSQEGLDRLIDGDWPPGGKHDETTRSGRGISDITLSFETYGNSGN